MSGDDPFEHDGVVSEAIAALLERRAALAARRDEAMGSIARIDRALDALGVEPAEDRGPAGDGTTEDIVAVQRHLDGVRALLAKGPTDVPPPDWDPREQDPAAYPGYEPPASGSDWVPVTRKATRPNPVREGGRPVNRDKRTIDYLRLWLSMREDTQRSFGVATAETGMRALGWTSSAEYPNAVVTVALGKLVKSGELLRIAPGEYRQAPPVLPVPPGPGDPGQFDDPDDEPFTSPNSDQ